MICFLLFNLKHSKDDSVSLGDLKTSFEMGVLKDNSGFLQLGSYFLFLVHYLP